MSSVQYRIPSRTLILSHYYNRALSLRVYHYLRTTYPNNNRTIIDKGAPGLTANLSILHHHKPHCQFLQSILHRNPQPETPTFSPMSRLVSVAQNHSFFFSWSFKRWGVVVTTPQDKNKEKRELQWGYNPSTFRDVSRQNPQCPTQITKKVLFLPVLAPFSTKWLGRRGFQRETPQNQSIL